MKSYLSLIPISARVRRRQNRLTILCIVTAVFLVTAIFSVADMMLRTQTGRAAGKSGSWHLEVTGITPEQVRGQPDFPALWSASRTWCGWVPEQYSMRTAKAHTA